MTKNELISYFDNISINGRYVYSYLCLRSAINESGLTEEIPEFLNNVLNEFVESDRLDLWQEKVDELLPSYILDTNHNEESFEFVDYHIIIQIREYYQKHQQIIIDIFENIFNMGLANLYGGFNSNITMPYLIDIISDLNLFKIKLPVLKTVKDCSVDEHHGWGVRTKISNFI